jgi:plasmid maintenance system killer protein
MLVHFKSKDLEQLYSNPNLYKWHYPKGIIKKFVKVVTILSIVDTVGEVNSFGKYQVSQKKWDMKWIRAARLNDSRRLEFTLEDGWDIQIVNLERISNHYE